MGRLGLLIHSHRGVRRRGWDGHLTLELSNVANLPIAIYPEMKIGQISFLQMTTPAEHPYGSGVAGSKYQGQRGRRPAATTSTSSARVSTYAPGYDPTAVMGRRIAAYIIDFCIAGIVFVGLFLAERDSYDKNTSSIDFTGVDLCDAIKKFSDASICFETENSALALTGGAAVAVLLVPLGISFANLVLLQGTTGASVGKYITGFARERAGRCRLRSRVSSVGCCSSSTRSAWCWA